MLGSYPDSLLEDGELVLDGGRMVPTTPWEAVWSGIAQWLGVAEQHFPFVLPNLPNFHARHAWSADRPHRRLRRHLLRHPRPPLRAHRHHQHRRRHCRLCHHGRPRRQVRRPLPLRPMPRARTGASRATSATGRGALSRGPTDGVVGRAASLTDGEASTRTKYEVACQPHVIPTQTPARPAPTSGYRGRTPC